MIGNVFSPYYALRRRRGPADPEQHVALNVALYGPARRWTLTERGRTKLLRDQHNLTIGPSSLEWDGTALTIRIDEVCAPIPRRVTGTVRVLPAAVTPQDFTIDSKGLHRWWPIAPTARVEARFERPALAWSGHGYLDSNAGEAPLEDGFAAWNWSRAAMGDGAVILYDTLERVVGDMSLSLRCRADGVIEPFDPPPLAVLPPTRVWRMARATRSAPDAARILATLEDTPFYSRSVIDTGLLGRRVTAVHESLSLDRFRRPVVQAMLPFRMPRRG